jgi:hypothetical protein
MYIPLQTTNFLPKNDGYAWEYAGTTVGPPLDSVTHLASNVEETLAFYLTLQSNCMCPNGRSKGPLSETRSKLG